MENTTKSLSTFVIVFICIIAVVIAIGVGVTLLYKTIKSKKQNVLNTLAIPPLNYMDNTTLNCPDYWTVVDDSGGQITCQNTNGFNNSSHHIDTKDIPSSYNLSKYMYPYKSDSSMATVIDNINNGYSIALDCSGIDDCIETKYISSNNNTSFMCPYSHPYKIAAAGSGIDSSSSKILNGMLCVSSDLSGYSSINESGVLHEFINKITNNKTSKKYKNSIMYCKKSKAANSSMTINKLLKDISNNKIKNNYSKISKNLPSIQCNDFSRNINDISQNLCSPEYPFYTTSKKCTNPISKTTSSSYTINKGVFKSNSLPCPSNYPIAFNMAKDKSDKNPLMGVFCSSKNKIKGNFSIDSSNNFNLDYIPSKNKNIVGCNATNLDLINNSSNLYYSCKSSNICPEDYPFSSNGGKKCCISDPKLDYEDNCKNPDYIISCPSGDKCKNNINSGCKTSKTFPKITEENWEKNYSKAMKKKDISIMSNVKGISERCSWIRTCGRVWQGIDVFC